MPNTDPATLIRSWKIDDLDRLLALNATAEIETSPLVRDELQDMLSIAYRCYVAAEGPSDLLGFVLAFDQDSGDDGHNFAWFRARYSRFVYVDRIIIDPKAKGRRLGQALYARLRNDAIDDGYPFIGCEVNLEPPNPTSLCFHERLGFEPIEDRRLDGGKIVRYLQLDL